MSRCFCGCHEHPGTYGGKYCGYCGHDNRQGRFPDTLRDGWEPFDSAASIVASVQHEVEAWERGVLPSLEAMESIASIVKVGNKP